MKTVFSFLLALLITLPNIHAKDEFFIDHHKVKAKRGDGVITMLSRFGLFEEECNVDAFYEVNKLKKDAMIYAGKEYTLPIKIYKYNKTSIRSTIGKDDWNLAKKIAAYNRFLQEKKLKKRYYMDDAILYVPFHLLDCPDIRLLDKKAKVIAASHKTEKKVNLAIETKKPIDEKPMVDYSIDHHRITAKRGDVVSKMLSQYGLYGYECNREAFYKANKINKNATIYVGKEYILPIKTYRYNKTSIRSTIGKDDWDLAKKIAAYNIFLKEKNIKPKSYQEDGILYVPFHLLDCPDASNISSKAKTVATKKAESNKIYLENELYGKDNRFEKVSDNLKGEVYYIISGHGGPDPGAMCTHGKTDLCEDEYAYDVSLRLARNLEANGAKVLMIIQDKNDGIRNTPLLEKDYDEICIGGAEIPRKQLYRLKQRVDAVNKHYAQLKGKYKKHKVIAIHVDSRPKHKRQDVFFYHCPGSDQGKNMAYNLQETFRQKYRIHRRNGEYHGTVTERNLYVLRNTNPSAVYVELANIRNHMDQKRIIVPSQRQYLADWLCEGIIK